eukprot:PhF_6_TR9969/c0_g1_i2/m.15141
MFRRNLLRVQFKWTCPILNTNLMTFGKPLNAQSIAPTDIGKLPTEEITKLEAQIGPGISEDDIRTQISAKQNLLAAELPTAKKPITMELRRPEGYTLPKGVRKGVSHGQQLLKISLDVDVITLTARG